MVDGSTACDGHRARFGGDGAQQGSLGRSGVWGQRGLVASGRRPHSHFRLLAPALAGSPRGLLPEHHAQRLPVGRERSLRGGWVPGSGVPPEPGGRRVPSVDFPALVMDFLLSLRCQYSYKVQCQGHIVKKEPGCPPLSFVLCPCSGMWTVTQGRPGVGRGGGGSEGPWERRQPPTPQGQRIWFHISVLLFTL